MTRRRRNSALLGMLAFGLTGCSSAVNLYHRAEGGTIAQARQPPPGADAPYPNLASVPAAPVALNAAQQHAVNQRLAGAAPDVSPPSPGALAGLELPSAPPPAPNVPGIDIPSVPTARLPVPPPAPAKTVPHNSAPVALSFAPGSALLEPHAAVALRGLAAARGQAGLLVGGFGDAASPPGNAPAIKLAVARAQRLAAALTADGVPPGAIHLVASAAGSGGFVQLVY